MGDILVLTVHDQTQFPLGQIVATPGALAALERAGQAAEAFLRRHTAADWGEIPDEDRGYNNSAVANGERLLSAYSTRLGEKIWVITEWDRSATTLLLPSEY